MSLTLISRPVINWSGDSSVITNGADWNAIFNPVIFHFERRDFTVADILVSPDFAGKVRVTSTAAMTGLAVGDSVYITSDLYTGLYTVLQINSSTSFDADTTYVGDEDDGFIVADTVRVNWYGEFQIYRILPNQQPIEIGTFTQKSFRNGELKVNVSGWLKGQCGFSNDFAYDKINQRDDNLGGYYWLYYRQRYDGLAAPAYTVQTENHYVNAARQIGDENGANMEDYQVEGATSTHKKFLTEFENPTYWPGYPFDLCFILTDLAGSPPTIELTRLENHFDVNGDVVSSDGGTELIEFGNDRAVNRLMIQQGYTDDVREIDVWLESGVA